MLQGAMSSRPKLPLSKREILFAFLASLAICLAIQVHGNAFSTDLSAHPDEPAHAVTGLMIRDYLAGGFLESNNPMAFAQNYYDRFPKVALGHYPPAFYILESVWLLPARSIPACIALIAALATTLLTLCYICIRKSFPDLPSLAAFLPAAAVPFVPMVGNSLVMVMSDLMLAVCCLGATMAFAKFAEKPSFKLALLFGILASAAGLTKASGLLLAIVPPTTCLLSGRIKLLLDKRLWVAPLPVALTVIPWILATRHITQEGMLETPVSEFIITAIQFYAFTLGDQFGLVALTLCIVYILVLIQRAWSKRSAPSPVTAALLSLVIATVTFYSAIPAGMEPRYLLPLTPCIAVLTAGGILTLLTFIKQRPLRGTAATILGGATIAGFCFLPEPVGSGFDSVTGSALATSDSRRNILVSSDAVGEGAVIANAAFSLSRKEAQNWKFLRSTKVLSTSDWMGRSYQPVVSTEAEMASLLDSENVSLVIEDHSIPEAFRQPHTALLHSYLTNSVTDDHKVSIQVDRTAHSDRQGSGVIVLAELEAPTPIVE